MSNGQAPELLRSDLDPRWVFALTVAAAYLYVFIAARAEFTPLELVANLGLGAVYLAWSLIGSWLHKRIGQRVGLGIYYVVASLLVLAIQWLGHGLLWLAMLPGRSGCRWPLSCWSLGLCCR